MKSAIADRADRLVRFMSPIVLVVRAFVPVLARKMAWVSALGIIGSLLNAAGYLALIPLVRQFTQGGENMTVGPLSATVSWPMSAVMLAVVVACLMGALQLNYLVQRRSLDILRLAAVEASVRGLSLLGTDMAARPRKRAVPEIAGPVAFACGFVMRHATLGLVELLQLGVFLAVLLWISTGMTLLFMGIAIVGAALFAGSLAEVARAASDRHDYSPRVRGEFDALCEAMTQGGLPVPELRARVEHLHREGAVGARLGRMLDMRREMKRGPLLMEYLYPVALIILPLLAIGTGELQEKAGQIIVYVLVLRNVIGLMQKLATLLISVGRHYPSLLCYADLLNSPADPRCRFARSPERGADEEDDDETF